MKYWKSYLPYFTCFGNRIVYSSKPVKYNQQLEAYNLKELDVMNSYMCVWGGGVAEELDDF